MPTPAPGSRRRAPSSSPSTAAVASPRFRATSATRWARALSAIALFGVVTSAEAQQTTRLSDDEIRRFAALLRMTDARQHDSEVIVAALGARAPALRRAGALAIGQVRATAMLPTARSLLADRDSSVAASAAYAIGLVRDSPSVPALVEALRGPSSVAAEAAWALGQIGGAARAAIEGNLAPAGARDPVVTGALLIAAAKLRPVPVSAIAPHLNSADPEIRWRAAYAIARPFAAGGVRALLPLVQDSSAMVRSQVARALSRTAAGDSLRAHALPALDSLTRDADAHVRINALRSLGTYGTAARAPLLAGVHDRDPNVRIAAAQSLSESMEKTREAWLPLWDADTSLMYRRSLLAAAMQAGVPLPVAESNGTTGWAESRDWRERAALAEASGGSPSVEQRRTIALTLTRDPDARVRAAAHDAIASLADSLQYPWARSALYIAFVDSDVSVRAGAVGALIGRASAADLPVVMDVYRAARRDSVSDARLTAIRFFVEVWKRDSASISDSLRAVLAALPVPTNPLERAAAIGATPLASWASAKPEPVRPQEWYESRVRELVVPAIRGQLPRAEFATDRGELVVELFALEAPLTVHNFLTLAKGGYYSGVRFHRVVPNFVAQDGDPRGDGNGGPAYSIRDELNRRRYDRGAVGMALSGPDTGGSQYFLTLSPQPHLDGGYTVFGRVVSGLEVMDALVQGDQIKFVRIR